MTTIRENITFKVYKKGRKWIQCFINFTHKEKKYSVQAKVLITEELKNASEGQWINNLAAEIKIFENTFTGKKETEAFPIFVDSSSSFVFNFGKYKFENIKAVESKDLNYLIFLSSSSLSADVKNAIDSVLSNYKIVSKNIFFDWHKGESAYEASEKAEVEEIEGYKFVSKQYSDCEEFITVNFIYRKL